MRILVAGADTVIWRLEELLAIFKCVEQASMPNLIRLKRDLKTEPAVGRNSLARSTQHGNCHCAAKIPVQIQSSDLLLSLRPFGSDLAAAYDVTRLDLEDVGEVASKSYLKLKTHWFHAVIGDVEIVVQAAAE